MVRRRAAVLRAGAAPTAALALGLLAGCGADTTPGSGTRTGLDPPRATNTLRAEPRDAPASTSTSREASLKPPLAFHVRRRTQLRRQPRGKVVATISTRTEFHSPTILAVAARKPGWLLVRTTVPGHHVGWLPIDAGRLFSEPRSIVIDLSRKTLTVFHRGKLTDVYRVAIGTDATPTPRGKFAVTDRLRTGNPQADYGCCILALTAHQPHIAQGWGGGDRVAIHATPHTWTIGKAVSHGCIRASNRALRQLMRHARLGMPVTIHA